MDVLLDAHHRRDSARASRSRKRPHVNIAIIGRPNVGKSTLLNQLVGAERSIVSAEPGTTRDAVDTVVERNGKAYRFLDTAGIRRKGKTKLIAEKLSVIMARQHLERADIALLVADAAQGITSHDATIASYAEQSGRSVIIVMNKWDLALEAAQDKSSEKKKRGGKFGGVQRQQAGAGLRAAGARATEISFLCADRISFGARPAKTSTGSTTLIDQVAEARNKRISTGELNRWVAKVDLDARHFAGQPRSENFLHHPGQHRAAHVSCCSPISSSRCISAISDSWKTSCARNSASSARPSASRSA